MIGKASRAADSLAAFAEYCQRTPGELQQFLCDLLPQKEFDTAAFYQYVWDPDQMVDLVNVSSLACELDWYVDALRTDQQVQGRIAARRNE
ncbi:hypothetical protein PQR33_05775 [Paraburkholderia sediminicola]|uniref:hypothetical protein n=1 Tax=Paraburkholderia sediminicola TaxID=458836 RepID=UPI0038B6C6BC